MRLSRGGLGLLPPGRGRTIRAQSSGANGFENKEERAKWYRESQERYAWESLGHEDKVRQAKETLGMDSSEQLSGMTFNTLKRHYWRKARMLHPDTATGDRERFVELHAALELLTAESQARRHRQEEARARERREQLNEELLRTIAEGKAEEFKKFCHEIKEGKRKDLDATTLFRILEGANLLYKLEEPEHATYCQVMIETWEDATGRRANRDVYHSIMGHYCARCECSLAIHRSLGMLMNMMSCRSIELTDQSIQMVRQMVRRAGRMGALGGEGSALRM
eukprot:Hpha_TRINITY_DN9535_c0_g1::TRINITY_DN9535_c0_g1_i1::g.114858::m.114858